MKSVLAAEVEKVLASDPKLPRLTRYVNLKPDR